ncbi:P-loop containing nucleoside triphosphate hydrolase protein [Pholiota conissans]|uniref:DNA 3'-5' helicase n=1 Tax=Pholiota conissans TaxID=109636 RepID=A0A9P6CRQ1_9AGAR|nr:P-loop containing nucleoside triphosphate hydrolase protein [Pholiota conissans]
MPAHIIARSIRSWLPRRLRKSVDYMHSLRSPQAKKRVMRDFRRGRIRVLVATESAGMGADIPDIEQVVQFGVPSSLSIWMQRAGRAGRSVGINARAILLAEKSMFERQRRRRQGAVDTTLEPEVAGLLDADENEGDLDEQSEAWLGGEIEYEWKKKVDEALRQWIETEGCRCEFLHKYFNNPVDLRKTPTHICCDNCDRMDIDSNSELLQDLDCPPTLEDRPLTPTFRCDDTPGSTHSTPSKSKNANGKRPIVRQEAATRRGPHLEQALLVLKTWRMWTLRDRYTPSPFTLTVFMPDSIIKVLASNARIKTLADLKANVSWAFTECHGEEVLAACRKVDENRQQEQEATKQARKDATAAQ